MIAKPPPPRKPSPQPPQPVARRPVGRPGAAKPRPVPAAPGFDWRERAHQYALLMRLHRPIGWLLLLWPTWWGLWMAAHGLPHWQVWVIFTLGVVVMRSAGCVINDWADRWLDRGVKRTRDRPLVSGTVSATEALVLFAVLLLIAFGLVLLTNPLTLRLAFVGVGLAVVYPFMKRHTHLPQLWLGAAFGWSVPMAYVAEKGELDAMTWLLFLANVLWSTAYDTIYAMVDRDDDIRMGARSSAILLGDLDLIGIGILHASFLLAMWLVGSRGALAWPYQLGWCGALAVILWQHWRIRHRDRDACLAAFQLSHWVGFALFAGMAAALSV